MAAIELLVEVRQAKEAVQSIDKRFENLDKSIDKVGDTFSRLEKSMNRIAASINKIVDPINKLNDSLGSLTRATGAYGKQIKLIEKANKRLSKELDKAKEDLKKTAENLARKARAANKATKELEKMDRQLTKTGKKLNVFGFNLGGINYALKQMNVNMKASEYFMTLLVQAAATFIAQNVVGYLIRMTDQFKLMESRLRIVNSNFATLNTNLSSTVSIALATRQSLFAVGNLMARIGRNSNELKTNTLELASATSTISKAFQIAGATAEEARNAIVQLSQALASGRLQGDELRSVLELAPTLAESISDSIGITVGQLRTFAREGLITTEVMLASISQSTDKINESFAKIRPTVSQALTNVNTSVQALLGFHDTFRSANDALARSFLTLAGLIRNFAGAHSDVIEPIARAFKTLAENILQIGAAAVTATTYFVGYIVVVRGLSVALKAAAAATAAFNAASNANPLVRLGSVILAVSGYLLKFAAGLAIIDKSLETFNKADKEIGEMGAQLRDLPTVLQDVQKEIDMVNKKARDLNMPELTPDEKATKIWAALTEAINYSEEAVKQYNEKIEDTKKIIAELEKSNNQYYRDMVEQIEYYGRMVANFFVKIAKIIVSLLENMANRLFSIINEVTIAWNKLLLLFAPDDSSFGQMILSSLRQDEKDLKRANENILRTGKELSDGLKNLFTGNAPKKGDLTLTKAIFGMDLEDATAELGRLESQRDKAMAESERLKEEARVRADKKRKNAQKLILDAIVAETEAAIAQYRLEAKLARESFNLAFKDPFNIRFRAVQSSLDNFAANFQKDFNKALQKLVPEAKFDITEFIKIGQKDSNFVAKNFIDSLRSSIGNRQVQDLTVDDLMPLFGLGVSKKGKDGFPFSSEMVDRLMEMSQPIRAAIKKLTEKEGGENIDPLLPKQLTAEAVKLVEKYASGVLQTLLEIEANLVSQLKTSSQTAEQDARSLKSQILILKNTEFIGNARIENFKKEMVAIKERSFLEKANEMERLRNIGITRQELEANTSEVAKAANEYLDLLDHQKELNKELKEQQLISEMTKELMKSRDSVDILKMERDLIAAGSSEFEIQKKKRDALLERELEAIEEARKTKTINSDLLDIFEYQVKKKYELLNIEKGITEENRIQREIQQTREQIAEDKLMKQAEIRARELTGEVGILDQILIERGVTADPSKKLAQELQNKVQSLIESTVSAQGISINRAGAVVISEKETKRLQALGDNVLERAMELAGLKLEQITLGQQVVPPQKSITDPLRTSDPNQLYYSPKAKGGFLRGSSHSSGGIKGFLYGQPIELEGGEFVISKAAVEKYGVSMFEALNAKKFQVGGVMGHPAHSRTGLTSRAGGGAVPVVVVNPSDIAEAGQPLGLGHQDLFRRMNEVMTNFKPDPRSELTPDKQRRDLLNRFERELKKQDLYGENKNRVLTYRAAGPGQMPQLVADTENRMIGSAKKLVETKKEEIEVAQKSAESTHSVMKSNEIINQKVGDQLIKLGYAANTLGPVLSNLGTSTGDLAKKIEGPVNNAVNEFRNQIKPHAGRAGMNLPPHSMGAGGPSGTSAAVPPGFFDKFIEAGKDIFEFGVGAISQAPGGAAGIEDIASIFASTADPITGSIKILTKRLAQNERFQKALERFFEMFYTIFDEVAEGLAFIFEALVDFVEPLKPILQMVGSSLREVLKAFTQIIRPFSILLEALQPVLVYLTGFLQIAVSVIATIFNFFGQGLKSLFEGIVESFGMDVGEDYKSLNLLKQERDILGEINSSISGLADTLKDIQDVMFDIQTSALNIAAPGVKLEIAAEKYAELYRAATAIGADDQAVNEFTAFAKQYLQQAQDVLKTSNAYQQIYIGVMEDIEGLQKTVADTVGGLATKEIQKAVFNLGLAGSSLGDDIVQVVDSVKAGIIGYDDFIQYVGYKLAQTGQDIDLKEFAEFGNITGKSLDALVTSFYSFRDDEFDRIAKGLEGASNASTVADDFKTLFGIDTLGNKIQGTTPLIISDLVEAVDTYGRDSAQVRKILDRQPTLGDIRDPGDVSQDPSKDGMSFDFTKLTGPDLLGPLLVAVQELFTNAVKAVQEAWGLIETNVNGLISEIDRVYKEALALLETNLEGIIAELEKGFKKLKENIESLGEIDLGNALQVNLESLKSQLDNLGIDLTDVDLANALQVNLDTIKAELDGIDFDLSGVDLATEFENALDELKITGLGIHLGEQIQPVIDKAIGEAEVLFDKLKMLKNPFYPAIGEDYLIEFEKGGLLQGPSHSQGGIKAIVGGGRMVELEGGEYIINKRATSNIGLGFLNFINNVGRKNISEKDFYNSSGMRKFENGGYPVNVGDAFNTDGLSYNIEDFFVSLDSLVENTANSLSVGVSGFGGSLKNKNPNAPSARKGPKSIERLFEPQNKIGNAQIIDIGLETNGVLKDIFGSHGFNLDIDFPGGANGEIFNTGGYVRQYYHSNTPNNLMPSGRMDSDAKEVKRRNKFEIPAYADERRGILNETANHPDRLGIGIKQSGNFTEGMLPGGVFSSISSAINNVLDEGFRFLTETVQLIAFFGGDLTRNYTKFSPFAGLDGSGKAKEEFNNPLEYLALLVTMVSAASWMYENFGGNKGGFGLTTVNDWLTPIGLGFGKDDAFGEMPIAPLAFLSYIPMLDSTNPILNLFGLRSDVEDKYGKKQFSILDALNIGFHTGYKNLSGLNDLQKFLLLYASYEVGNAAFGLDLFSPLDSLFNLFGGGRSSSSRGESSALSRMPAFLGGSSRSSSGRSSYSGGSRGERSAIARMPDFLEQGGLAVGPSHDSGMLGLAGGKPFLFEGGEYIVNKNAVDKIGVNTLNKINQGNMPKFADGGPLAGGSLEHLQERSFFGKIADFFTFDSNDGWGNVLKGLMVGLGAAASYGVYQLLQGTDADADYIDRDYANDVTRVADYAKDLVENPYKIIDTATGTMNMAFGAVEGTIDTISQNFSDIESKGLINTLEYLTTLDYLDTGTYLGTPGEALGAAVGEVFRGHYQAFIGQSKKFDPLFVEKLKYAGLDADIADNVKYVLSERSPIDTLYGDIFRETVRFLGDSSTYGNFVKDINAGHPVAFVTDNLTTIRTNSGYFRNAVDNDIINSSSYSDPGKFIANGNLGPFNIWEYAGWLMAHEAYHSQQYKEIGGNTQGSRKRFKNFFSAYIDNFSEIESEASQFANDYSSIFGSSGKAKKPALNMPKLTAGSPYFYSIQMFGKSFDPSYLGRNFDTNWFNDTNPEFGYYDYFRPPTTAVNPQAPTSNYPEFGSGGSLMSGGVASGPSHQGGIMGFAEGGGPFLFEGGEYIINKDATKALGIDFLDSLNTGGVIPQAGLSDPLQQLLISQRQTPNYMYGTMSAQDMRMQAANILLPMAFTGELGLFSSDLSRSFGNRGKLSSGLFGAGVGLLYGGLLGALVGNKGRDNVALSLLFSGIGSYSGVSQNRPENYPSGRKLFDFASGGSVPSYQIGGIFPDIESGDTTYKTDNILAALLGLGGIGMGISYMLDAFSPSRTTSSRTNIDNVLDRLPEFLGGPAARVSTTTSPSSGPFDGLLGILAFLGGSKLLYDSLGKYTDEMIEKNNKSGSTSSDPNDFAPYPDTFDYGALTRFYNTFVPDSGHKIDKSFLHSIGHFSYSNEKGPYLFTGVSFGSYLDNIRDYDPYDLGIVSFNYPSGVDSNLINDFYLRINQRGIALGNKILVEDTPSASDLSIGYTGGRSLIEPYSKLISGTNTRSKFNSSISGMFSGNHSTSANYYSNGYNALKYLPFIGMMSESNPNFMLTGDERKNYDYHINSMSNIAEMFDNEDDPFNLKNNKGHSLLHNSYFSGPNPHSPTFPNFPEYYISDLLAWHIGSGGASVSYKGKTYDEGGIVGFDPFGVSAMGDISTSLRVGPRYQSQQPDYGFGFMDFMSLMGIFALLNNLRFMDEGGLLPYQRDPYLDPGAYGKARDNRYNRSARGKAGRISKAMYKDLSSFFGPIGDYLVPDFLNPFGEEASIQGFLKSIFYDIPLGIYNFATESVPNYFSSVFGIGGEKSRRAKASHEGFFGFGKGGVIPSLYMGGDKYGSLGSGRKTRYVDDRTVFKNIFDYGENKSGSSISEIMKDIDIFYAKKRLGHAKQAESYSKPGKPFDFKKLKLGILGTTFPLAAFSFFSRRTRGSSGLSDYLNRDLEIGEEAPSDFEKILALGDKGPLDPVRALFYLAYGTALYSHLSDYPKFMKMKNPLYSRRSGGTIPSMRQGGGEFNIKDYLTPEMGLNMFLGGMFGGMMGTGLGVDPLTMMLFTLSGLGMGAYGGYRATNRQDLLGNPIGELFGKGGRISEAGLGGDFSKFMMATMLLTGGSHIYGALGGNKRAASIGKGIGFGALSAGYSYGMLDLAKDESQSDLGRAIALYFGLAPLIGPIGFTDSYPHFMPYEAIASGFRGEQFGKGGNIPSFGSGGSLQTMRSGPAIGPDHQSGMLGVTKQGAPFLFEGGEYIVSRAAASRIGSSNLDQLNKGKIPDSMASGGSIPEAGGGLSILDQLEVISNYDKKGGSRSKRRGMSSRELSGLGEGLGLFSTGIASLGILDLLTGGKQIGARDNPLLLLLSLIGSGIYFSNKFGSGGSIPSFKNGINLSPGYAASIVFDQDYGKLGKYTAGSIGVLGGLGILGAMLGSDDDKRLDFLSKEGLQDNFPSFLLASIIGSGALFGGAALLRGTYTGKGFMSGASDIGSLFTGLFRSGGSIPSFGRGKGITGIPGLDLFGGLGIAIAGASALGQSGGPGMGALLPMLFGLYMSGTGLGNVLSYKSGGVIPQAGMGADPNFFNKTLPATLGLMGIFSYTGFGDFLGDFGNRNKKMTAGRAGRGFGQFAGGLLSALLMISGSKDKNPLGLIAGLATLVGTRKLFADTPRGRSSNPFSFSDTQKYNRSMFASGGFLGGGLGGSPIRDFEYKDQGYLGDIVYMLIGGAAASAGAGNFSKGRTFNSLLNYIAAYHFLVGGGKDLFSRISKDAGSGKRGLGSTSSSSTLFGSGGLLPSYKAGEFPIPDAFTMGSIGVGAGVGAFLGSVLGKDNEELLPILMLTGILGGGFLGNFFGQRRRQGFDLFGNLLPRHGKIRSGVNYGFGGAIPSFGQGGTNVDPGALLLLSLLGGGLSMASSKRGGAKSFGYGAAGTAAGILGVAAMNRNFGYGSGALIPALAGLYAAFYGSDEFTPMGAGLLYAGLGAATQFGSGGSIPYFQAGGLAKGPSHESGMVGYSKSGGPFMFEGGEYIIRKSSVDKLGVGTLDALNRGMYSMGKGGVIPSFEEGTNMGGLPIEAGMYARRDLFGIKSSDDTEEVYVTNYSDMSGAGIYGASTVELLAGISLILQSMLISTYNEEGNYLQLSTIASEQLLVLEMFASNQLAIPDSMYKMTELMDENNKIVTDNEGNAVMVKTQELTEEGLKYQKQLTDAGIQPGKLLRIELSLIGPMAMSQLALLFASMAPQGPSLDDQLFSLAVQGAVQYAGLTGSAAGLATLGIYHGRETAEEGKGDLAAAAGIAALVGITAVGGGPALATMGAIAAAEVMGKPENYFAEIGIDEQMDLQEPVTGLYDELVGEKGILTYPAKFFSQFDVTQPGNAIANAGDRLNEGAAHMNMNSQKLSAAMSRAFGMDESEMQFDALGGFETTLSDIDTYSEIEQQFTTGFENLGERTKQLGEAMFKDIGEAIVNFFKAPLDYLNNLGKQIQDNIQGSLADLIGAILNFPKELLVAADKVLGGAVSEFIEAVQEIISIPIKFIENLINYLDLTIASRLPEFLTNLAKFILLFPTFPITLIAFFVTEQNGKIPEFMANILLFFQKFILIPFILLAEVEEGITENVPEWILNLAGLFLAIVLFPVTLGLIVAVKSLEFIEEFDENIANLIKNILNIPIIATTGLLNFIATLPAQIAGLFGIEFPFFELQALNNPFKQFLGGPQYLIDIAIGKKSEGDGGLINYGKGGVLQTGGLAVGPSHQSGMLGMTKKGTPFLFEGGEYIINKKTTDLLGSNFMSEVNEIQSNDDLKHIYSLLSIFGNGGGLFSADLNDVPLGQIVQFPNPLARLGVGPSVFKATIDPSEGLDSIDLTQNLFENGGGVFDILGSVTGNTYEKNLISADNPFTKTIEVIERYQKRVGGWLGSFLKWVTRTVRKVVPLGPDELKVGIKGKYLDLYNSSLSANFGSDVLGKLGLGSLPTPTMAMGGLVHGPSHGNGGVVAEMEGGEYVINRNSASELGSSFLGGLNSGGANFASSLVTSSNMSNQLLNKLIQVVEEKDLSVNINNEPAEETPTEDIRLSIDRERAYRGSRMLA